MKKLLPLLFSLPLLLFAGVNWDLPSNFLFNTPSQDGILPSIAIDPSGNAIAAWVNSPINGTGTPRVQVSYRTKGGNWSTPEIPLESADPVGVVPPAVAIDKNGNAVVAWFAFTNGYFTVQAAMKPAKSNVWNISTQVSPQLANSGDVVAAWDGDGNAIIAWSLFGGRLQSRSISLKGVMNTVVDVSALSSVTSNALMVANASGDILATWINTSPNRTVQAAFKNSSGTWSAPLNVSTAGMLAQYPVAAYDNDLNAVIVWNNASQATNIDIYSSQKRAKAAAWSDPILITDTAFNSPSQQVAIDANENVTVAWVDNAATSQQNPFVNVKAKTLSEPLWPTEPTTISNLAHESEGCLSLGVNSINEKVVLWAYDSTTSYPGSIVSRSLSHGATDWSTEVQLSDQAGTSPGSCSLSINAVGEVVAIWSVGEASSVIQTVGGTFPVINPINVSVKQLNNDFALLSEYYNILKWDASISPGVAGYNIYLYDTLIATVGPKVTQYEVHNLIKGQPATYTVSAISTDGQESTGTTTSLE